MNQVQEYIYPTNLDEALSLLDEASAIIAGGTHLVTSRGQSFSRLIDITRLKMNYIKKNGQQVHIGSTTTITEMIESSHVKEIGNGILLKACKLIGDTPLRNRITIGGNIARRYPWAGLPIVLLVLEAEVKVISKSGEESIIPAHQFFGPRKLKSDEIIIEVIFPLKSDWFCQYEKFSLTTVDYAWITMAFSAKNNQGIITDPHVAVSRITNTKRVEKVEKLLDGKPLATLNTDEIISTLKQSVNIVPDYRSSKEYRKHLLGVLFKRIITKMVQEAQ
jgi:carbon-monoxide dehydrogenase medium subunit